MNSNRETPFVFEFSFLGLGLGVVLLGTKQGDKNQSTPQIGHGTVMLARFTEKDKGSFV